MNSENFNTTTGSIDIAYRSPNDIASDIREIKEFLKRKISEIQEIPMSEINDDAPFFEYGLRGSVLQTFIDLANGGLPIKLKLIDFFNYPNLSALTSNILDHFSEETASIAISNLSVQKPSPEHTSTDSNKDLIAVIGMSGKFGSAGSIDEFREVLINGESLIQEVPDSRWSSTEYYTKEKDNAQKTYSKWGSFLQNIDQFDPAFFRISGRDAEVMDPQQRLFLEESWKALEDAGIDPDTIKSLRCGIFTASGSSYYTGVESEEASSWWGNDPAILAGRVSYFLDAKGPAINVDTACSSSLTAIHMACNSLKAGESDITIAGGVWIATTPFFYTKASRAKMLSPDGTCYAFDTRANGFVPGEAVGVLILKRLEDAERDGDQIHGVIRGTHLNQDGTTNGITAPSGLAQQTLLKDAFEKFKVNPATIGCVEAHGTGTRLGDPIEFEALKNAFRNDDSEDHTCSLGSVKTNLGHTVMAAGVSGVIKMILSLKHQTLFPTLNFQTPNPLLDIEKSPFHIQKSLQTWDHKGREPRRATVSSFGFSGTNVVAIVEEYQQSQKEHKEDGPALILLSATTEKQLKDSVADLKKYIEKYPKADLHSLAYTLQVGRKSMEEKAYIIAENIADLQNKLEYHAYIRKGVHNDPLDKDQISTAIAEKNWPVLGTLWLNNQFMDWKSIYGDLHPSKISLPGYSFARDSYWFKKDKKNKSKDHLHPLVQTNISGFSGQRFISAFSGKEFFFSDHKVLGSCVLPGVAYLEMARAAAMLSQSKGITGVREVNWMSPIRIEKEETEVGIHLQLHGEEFHYEIESGDGDSRLKSKGILYTAEQDIVKKVDLQNLRNQFTTYWSQEICYRNFKDIGLDYGVGFRGIQKLFFKGSEVFAEIELPHVKDIQWNSGILDAALQCCVGLVLSGGTKELMLPFRLKEAVFYGELPQKVWAHIRKQDSNSTVSQLTVFDIDLISAEGKVVCSMTGLSWAKVASKGQENRDVTSSGNHPQAVKKERGSVEKRTVRESTIDMLREFVGAIVKFEKSTIKPERDFMSYGFDSNMLVKLAGDINSFYDVQLTPALFYSYSSINELVDFLEEEHLTQLQNKHHEIHIHEDKELMQLVQEPEEFIQDKEDIKHYDKDTVAIVGISGRFPGSEDLNDFWQQLRDKKNMITEIPSDRWDWKAIYGDPASDPAKTKAKWGGFISDIDKFDALFFGISPAEAMLMDPQQRIFIEAVYTALEDAGITPSEIKGTKTGVFVGTWTHDYQMLLQEFEDLYVQGQIPSGTMHSILANRISYLLDLHGPSEPIDTACSSALIAIHRAVENIRSGRCTMAIAGGVNALLSPETTLYISNAGMLSEDGNCKSFDESANGYVRSEGVGAVILKTLEQAQKDGDHIYALIRGTAENHGGKANTLTSPNPLAQRDLLLQAYRSAGIDPGLVSYIETHGTGTSLGDPIETEGLKMAFEILYKEWGKSRPEKAGCAIGAVKANVGHLESAAGMAGIIKVLLAMKHKVLPGNPLLKKPNPYLRLDGSPFYLLEDTEHWLSPDNRPRIAGVSSFGFGGVNAHIILEEYMEKKEKTVLVSEKMMIPLSAKNTDRLKKRAEDLLAYFDQNPGENFLDIVYTLQVGREAMNERIVLIAENLLELSSQLKNYLNGNENGIIKPLKKEVPIIKEEELISLLMVKNIHNLQQLAQLWADGALINWQKLYPDKKPSKLSLPTYPFLRKRHWFSGVKKPVQNHLSHSFSYPMLEQDHSTEDLLKYTLRFTGNEDYLKDHKVDHKVLFPGVAYIEMICEALKKKNETKNIHLKNFRWISPLCATEEGIDLSLQINSSSNFEFRTESGVHSRGKIAQEENDVSPVQINLAEIRGNLGLMMEGNKYYDSVLNRNGLEYGKGYQGIEKIYYDKGVALAYINNRQTQSEFVLTPCSLDNAFQATMAAMLSVNSDELLVPSLARQIKIYSRLPDHICSYVVQNQNTEDGYSFDIIITDLEGNRLVELFDLIVYPLHPKEKITKTMEKTGNTYTRLYNYSWQPESIQYDENKQSTFQKIILFQPISEHLVHGLKMRLNAEVIVLPELDIEDRFIGVIDQIKKIKKGRILIVYDNAEALKYNYLSGVLKTAHLENPYVSGLLVGADLAVENNSQTITDLLEKEQYATATEILLSDGQRWTKRLTPISTDRSFPSMAKPGGVYLVTGGAGGVGRIFSEYLAQTHHAEIIMVGRKPEHEIKINKSNIHYFACDITNKAEVALLIRKVKERFGKLSGIIHGAGVIQDSYIAVKTEAEIRNVFAPKTKGLLNLDEETAQENLDYFMLLSSIASVAGNIGQADYSSANAWMDNFAVYRNELKAKGLRSGATRSINWPLWKDGGMQIDPYTADLLEKKWGMLPMPSSEGILAAEALLASPLDQGVVIYGNKEFVLEDNPGVKGAVAENTFNGNHQDDHTAKEEAGDYILSLIAEILNYEKEELSTDSELRSYGFSSYLLVRFSNELNAYYDLDEPPTIFHNYPTVNNLVDFLWENHHDKISEKHRKTPVNKQISEEKVSFSENNHIAEQKEFSETEITEEIGPQDKGVAVVGVAGRFPGADTIDAFWELFNNNEDVVTEIPKDRWDWQKYDGSSTEGLHKTKAKWGGFINDIDKFDAAYFDITPKEAELMDPQQRLTLETVHTALEDAGIAPSSLKGSNTGVFIGVMNNDYAVMLRRRPELARQAYTGIGNSDAVLANRISFVLDLHGPSEPIKTACSSSLIAVHRAAEKIRSGHCNIAIAGGVNIIVLPETTLMISNAGMLSEDGRCRSFDHRANGYVRSEGVGIVILKSLELAKKDGDHIYGIIRGSAENHGGRATSLTAPNPKAQRDLLLEAYRSAEIDPSMVSYIEAHGTGTALGDPIEVEGLKMAFDILYKENGISKPEVPVCAVASAKANIGHAESASGIAGFIKILMALKHKILPGNPQLTTPNPYLQMEGSPFYLQSETSFWNVGNGKLRTAGISSFGFGGANAHIVIQEYRTTTRQHDQKGPAVILLSAKNKERLKEYAQKLNQHIKLDATIDLHSIAYTLQTGRDFLEERIAWIAEDKEHLTRQLESYLKGEEPLFSGNTVQGKASLKILNEAIDEEERMKMIEESNYRTLLNLWCLGAGIDWALLYGEQRPEKMKLPTYPFERKRYWIPELQPQNSTGLVGSVQQKEPMHTVLQKIVADTIRKPVEDINIEHDFFDFGLDSISGSDVIRNINEALKIKIDFQVLYEHTSIASLAEFINQGTGEKVFQV